MTTERVLAEDQDIEGQEGQGRRMPPTMTTVWFCVLLVIAYIVSPVVVAAMNGGDVPSCMYGFYAPLVWLYGHCPPYEHFLDMFHL